ncbi:hypothetical protein B0J17DRAFT_657710 [Rhizoctonia solani]|nr:hypothetical protein B0J17DRAFT_657710 [Rhizoctonia solani]
MFLPPQFQGLSTMTTEASQNSQANEYVYTPPALPVHISRLYDLKPIVGQPADEEVKAIHAVIRTVDAGSRIPDLYGPDLPLELSQHLFSIQMAVYRNKYPMNIFPGENTYTPPSLPTYIPTQLEPVTGVPSKEQLKVAQNAMKAVDSLGNGPLFDPDLNAELPQHLFNLQFARYIEDSNLGQFVPKPAESRYVPSATRAQQASPSTLHTNLIEPLTTSYAMEDVKELLSESKGVLENMNRVLISIQRNQITVGEWSNGNLAHLNPVNEQGISAVGCGLPQLRFTYCRNLYDTQLNSTQLTGYLKFFGIGEDLIEEDEDTRLKAGEDGKSAAEALIFKHLGLSY